MSDERRRQRVTFGFQLWVGSLITFAGTLMLVLVEGDAESSGDYIVLVLGALLLVGGGFANALAHANAEQIAAVRNVPGQVVATLRSLLSLHWLRVLLRRGVTSPASVSQFPVAQLLLAVTLVVAAVGLGVAAIPRESDPATGRIVIAGGPDPSRGQQRDELIEGWNTANPDRRAFLAELPDRSDLQRSKLLGVGSSVDTEYDVLSLDLAWVPEFAEAGAIRPLGDCDSRSPLVADFQPEALRAGCYRGKLWTLPFSTDTGLLYYRADVLGVASENPATTWEDLWDQARLLRSAGAGSEIPSGYVSALDSHEGLTVSALEMIWGAGGELIGDNGRVALPSAEAATGLGWLVDGLEQGVISEKSLGYQEPDAREAFMRGEALFLRGSVSAHELLRDDPRLQGRVGVTTLPGPSVLGGQGFAISAFTERPEAARALIEFLTSEQSQTVLFREGGMAPARVSVLDSAGDSGEPEYVRVLRRSLTEARLRPQLPGYNYLSLLFHEHVHAALEEGEPPDLAYLKRTLERTLR